MTKEHKITIAVILCTIALVIGMALFSEKKSVIEKDRLSMESLGEKIEEMNSPHITLGQEHEEYNSNPPTSGPHVGDDVAGPGIKDYQVSDELVVHSLEHGAVVLWYREDLSQDDIEKLTKIFNEASGKKIMIPRKNMDTAITLTSWGYLMRFDTIEEEKIKDFIEINSDRGPEKAPI